MKTSQKNPSELNLEDIAHLTGYSRSTVSRVLNNHPNVSRRTRDKVMQVIREYNFQPNPAARALATQRSQVLSVVIPYTVSDLFQDPYFPIVLQNITIRANQLDYSVILELTSTVMDEKTFYERTFTNRLAAAFIVVSAIFDEILIDHLIRQDRPCMVIGHPPPGLHHINFVDTQNIEGSYQIVSYLISKGYQRIGIIPGREGTATVDRLEGYRQALLHANRPVEEELIAPSGHFTESGGYHSMQFLIRHQVDAVFCASDMMAIGAMRAIREEGLHIPNDIAVCGFDDIPVAAVATPPLTTIQQQIDQLGFYAAEGIITVLKDQQKSPYQKLLPVNLIVRESA